VPLDTVHAEKVDVRINPLDRVDPTAEIRRRLEKLHPKATVYLTVGGYADVEAMGTTEKDLSESIKQFESDDRVADVVSRWSSVGDILQHELFRRINDQLRTLDADEAHIGAIRNLVIDAMTETVHAD
jgi:hypothetical protein